MKDDRIYLSHIREAIEKILSYTAGGREQFMGNPMIQDAVIRNFEIVGEAVKRLSAAVKIKRPEIPWRRVGGFRDVLIHDYMGVELEEVWGIVESEIPRLCRTVEDLLRP